MTSTTDTTLDRAIKLGTPNEEYYLTTWSTGDEQDVFEIMSIDAVSDRLISVPKPYKLEDAHFWTNKMLTAKADLLSAGSGSTVQDRSKWFFAQENPIPVQVIRHGGPAGKFVGCSTLTPKVGTDVVELGYYLHPAHQGRGLMAVASVAAIKWAKDEFGIKRVYSCADGVNPASQRTIEKVAAETAVDEIETGTKMVTWDEVKVVEGREKENLARTWEWSVE